MGRRAASATKKTAAARKHLDKWTARATQRYKDEQMRELGPDETRKGARKICEEIQEEHLVQYGMSISISHTTITRHAAGGEKLSDFNASKSWVLAKEEPIIISYARNLAARGFPLNHALLKECIEAVVCARLGDAFPADGLGKNFTARFLEKHSDQLRTCWASNLENKRGRAVNPATHEAWFQLLEETLAGKKDWMFDEDPNDWSEDNGPPEGFVPVPVLEENIYGMDESGFLSAGNTKTRTSVTTAITRLHPRGGPPGYPQT
ncbi:unnamed protein product [Mycena citricolor]|uniref:HTH CENPB-type domain-containing protein n=1 Tax=Mycena citricolor TaxID=2018698 RepID=A0AAD2K296_9AGAR|nr:unnamed protein product [Mycena citricolor]